VKPLHLITHPARDVNYLVSTSSCRFIDKINPKMPAALTKSTDPTATIGTLFLDGANFPLHTNVRAQARLNRYALLSA